jgi:phosphomethylpyrimidine synthase
MYYFGIKSRFRNIEPQLCGEGQYAIVLGSVGTSSPGDDIKVEFEKAEVAQSVGANVITDHSFFGDIAGFQLELVKRLRIAVSTVTCYEFAVRLKSGLLDKDDRLAPLRVLEEQINRGIDMITVHASLKQDHLQLLRSTRRLIPTTSKGGGIVSAYMLQVDAENPYYEYFDDVLDMLSHSEVTLSLGTSFRTASVCDGWDDLIDAEVNTMGELVRRALDKNVNVMVEGFGHVTLRNISQFIIRTKSICHDVPYRVLPVATDIALGFDHISSAIAGAAAVAAGADAITAVSRAEHVGLPSSDDLKEAIVAAKIAAHCGDLCRLGFLERDRKMSLSRWEHGCKGDWTVAIYPDGAREALKARNCDLDDSVQCSMCNEYCGIGASINAFKSRTGGSTT